MACLDRVDKYRQVRTASQLQVNIVCRSSLAGRRMLDVVAMQPAPGSGETGQWRSGAQLMKTRRLPFLDVNA